MRDSCRDVSDSPSNDKSSNDTISKTRHDSRQQRKADDRHITNCLKKISHDHIQNGPPAGDGFCGHAQFGDDYYKFLELFLHSKELNVDERVD